MLQHINLRRRQHECCVFVGASSQFIRVGNVAELDFERTDTWSLVCYFRTTAGGFECFMSKGDNFGGASLGRGWELSLLSGRLHTRIDSNDVTNGITKESALNTYNDGQWHQAVLTYAGTSLASGVLAYIDGAAITFNTIADTLTGTIQNTFPFDIGAQNGTGFFDGHLDEVAVYNTVLTAGNVTTLYNGGTVFDYRDSGIAGLVGYWRMAEGSTFPIIPDISASGNDGTMTNMTHFGPTRTRVPRPA